jgi:hypothetical protein
VSREVAPLNCFFANGANALSVLRKGRKVWVIEDSEIEEIASEPVARECSLPFLGAGANDVFAVFACDHAVVRHKNVAIIAVAVYFRLSRHVSFWWHMTPTYQRMAARKNRFLNIFLSANFFEKKFSEVSDSGSPPPKFFFLAKYFFGPPEIFFFCFLQVMCKMKPGTPYAGEKSALRASREFHPAQRGTELGW